MQPLVSVIIPSYNHGKYIEESVLSIVNQDYENIELIIIDDGSIDNSLEVIKKLIPVCESRFTRFEFRHRSNKGLCATLNEALEWCEGEYYSPFASDDVALPNKISFLVERITLENHPAVFGSIQQLGEKDSRYGVKDKTIISFDSLFMHKTIPPAPAALISLEHVRNLGFYDESIRIEDWCMWLRLCESGEVLIWYPEVVAMYRRHDKNTVNNYELMYKEKIKILNRYQGYKNYRKALEKQVVMYLKAVARNSKKSALVYLMRYRPKSIRLILKGLNSIL